MRTGKYLKSLAVFGMLALASLACGLGSGGVSQPSAAVAPISLADLGAVDVCAAIPVENIEAVMGRELESAPEPFEYYDTAPGDSSGCTYYGGSDGGVTYFAYVAFVPVETYSTQPLYKNAEVSGLGQAAYFNNGADARQLWVKITDQAAMVVAFGDEPREDGAKALAELILAAVK
jgi:hypothetical protein